MGESKMKITKDVLFVDDLDGKWTLGIDMGSQGTMSLYTFDDCSDNWIYPEDINEDYIINVWFNDFENKWEIEVYDLPINWREIATQDKGKDGKPSIHDIMVSQG